MKIERLTAIVVVMASGAPVAAQAVVESHKVVPSGVMLPAAPPPAISLQTVPMPLAAISAPSETQCRNMARAATRVAGYAQRFATSLAQCRAAYPHPDPKIETAEPKGSRDLVAKVPSRVPPPTVG